MSTDMNRVIDLLGSYHILTIQQGADPATAAIRVYEKYRPRRCAELLVTREVIDHANFDIVEHSVAACITKIAAIHVPSPA